MFLALAISASACNNDVDDAQIEGKVVDAKTEVPIEGVRLVVKNAYYEDGDHDSYNKYNTVNAVSNASGVF